MDVPLPADFPASGRGTGHTMIGTEDTFRVCAGNLGIDGISAEASRKD